MLKKLVQVPPMVVLMTRWLRAMHRLGYQPTEINERVDGIRDWAAQIRQQDPALGKQKMLATIHLDIHRAAHGS